MSNKSEKLTLLVQQLSTLGQTRLMLWLLQISLRANHVVWYWYCIVPIRSALPYRNHVVWYWYCIVPIRSALPYRNHVVWYWYCIVPIRSALPYRNHVVWYWYCIVPIRSALPYRNHVVWYWYCIVPIRSALPYRNHTETIFSLLLSLIEEPYQSIFNYQPNKTAIPVSPFYIHF